MYQLIDVLIVLLLLWSVFGAIIMAVLRLAAYYPVKNHKLWIMAFLCGPIVWIVFPLVLFIGFIYNSADDWLKKEARDEGYDV